MTARERTKKHASQWLFVMVVSALLAALLGLTLDALVTYSHPRIEGDITMPNWMNSRNNTMSMVVGCGLGIFLVEAMWFMNGNFKLQGERVKEDREKLKQEILAELKKK